MPNVITNIREFLTILLFTLTGLAITIGLYYATHTCDYLSRCGYSKAYVQEHCIDPHNVDKHLYGLN